MTRRRRLPRGISQASDRSGFLVQVMLRKHRRTTRFPPGTSIADMQDWQDEQRRELRRLVPSHDRRRVGTFTADVETYLERWPGAEKHPDTRSQREWYLRLWAAHFGERRRHSIKTHEIAEQLAYWRDHGLPQKAAKPGAPRRRQPPETLAPATVVKVRHRKLDRDHVQAEIAALEAMLQGLPADDALGRMSLEARRRGLMQELETLAGIADNRAAP